MTAVSMCFRKRVLTRRLQLQKRLRLARRILVVAGGLVAIVWMLGFTA